MIILKKILFNGGRQGRFETVYRIIEDILVELAFISQNVCGAPVGYNFAELLS